MKKRSAKLAIAALIALGATACAELPTERSVDLKYCSVISYTRCQDQAHTGDCAPC